MQDSAVYIDAKCTRQSTIKVLALCHCRRVIVYYNTKYEPFTKINVYY